MKIMLTGATGFVGRALIVLLHKLGHECIGVARKELEIVPGINVQSVGDISGDIDWADLLSGVDCVVHLAARAHLLRDDASDPQLEFDRVNYHATMSLVKQAADAGVKRFVYVSSIGVHGATSENTPFTENSALIPHSFYAISKLKAEKGIQEILRSSTMEWVIVRPPLIYAADAPGNFQLLLKLVSKGFPLPFANVRNSRSMVSLTNLIDFLSCCVTHPRAAGEVFVISDGADLSIGDIVKLLAQGMGKRASLFGFPKFLIKVCATLVGRKNIYVQLFESLQVDSSKAQRLLGWRPLLSARDGLLDTGRASKLTFKDR